MLLKVGSGRLRTTDCGDPGCVLYFTLLQGEKSQPNTIKAALMLSYIVITLFDWPLEVNGFNPDLVAAHKCR